MIGLLRWDRPGNCSGRPVAFIDRDGTVNELRPHPVSGRGEAPMRPDEVELMPGAAEALFRLRESGVVLVCVTNKPDYAKGLQSIEDLLACHGRVVELLRAEGVGFDSWRLCLHHPTASGYLGRPCECRKPEPGMLLDAVGRRGLDVERSWMIGDTDGDLRAGRGAGAKTICVTNPDSAHKRTAPSLADAEARSLLGAVHLLTVGGNIATCP